MDTQELERQKRLRKMEELWNQHQAEAITDDDGTYVRLKEIHLSDHELELQDTRAPGNMSLSPTSNTQHDNFFLRRYGAGDVRLFRNRNYKRNI